MNNLMRFWQSVSAKKNTKKNHELNFDDQPNPALKSG
jgi:hypothetical protein